jgi:hypothetical protein
LQVEDLQIAAIPPIFNHTSAITTLALTFWSDPAMKPPTDYIRHAARLARKIQTDAALGGSPQADAEFYKALAKALEEVAAGLELVSPRE